ncbi:hypothetical protein GUITHDRAFT_114806 [Guillardia theta CCMP2712]|uniref:Uncharacterized protein n=1 Tax=Guillardia theta (strain CCMP2712) TaxID=905079 RepID=L1ISQ8_GUITC|nr:hypothetical protein GUITHDRAFT_114806 [Guillardia theta CCMP2712]EKX39147.1 hypothetical protein GUITHDRAFT_114806 [Guillardia theta CCMP2712]|mmetsp:Transcript_33133/g.104790  ORF Transcript_33133/g.104790 Transcript_33133/m.104790 type:complete len:84 (+) Transcript_33133:219-470(+)|eukprot:XP_005826127.1 hypothetical protein GUITHDRAFT_114806 [Guillardia theta CCMP2712]
MRETERFYNIETEASQLGLVKLSLIESKRQAFIARARLRSFAAPSITRLICFDRLLYTCSGLISGSTSHVSGSIYPAKSHFSL